MVTHRPCPHCRQTHAPDARFCPVTGAVIVFPAPIGRRTIPRLSLALVGLAGVVLLGAGIWQLVSGTGRVVNPSPPDVPPMTTTPKLPVVPSLTVVPVATSPRSTRTPGRTATQPVTAVPTHTFIPLTFTATPQRPWSACPDSPLSQLRVGNAAYVSFDPPLANRVRAEPNRQARRVGQIEPGEIVLVLEGPACADAWVWWKVQSNSTGLLGWTAEGDENDYWLLPCQTQDGECYSRP